MGVVVWLFLGLVVWTLVACAVGFVVGSAARLRDEHARRPGPGLSRSAVTRAA